MGTEEDDVNRLRSNQMLIRIDLSPSIATPHVTRETFVVEREGQEIYIEAFCKFRLSELSARGVINSGYSSTSCNGSIPIHFGEKTSQ